MHKIYFLILFFLHSYAAFNASSRFTGTVAEIEAYISEYSNAYIKNTLNQYEEQLAEKQNELANLSMIYLFSMKRAGLRIKIGRIKESIRFWQNVSDNNGRITS